MSDSIARLAVVITGDASPLAVATRQATGYVKQFESQTTGSLAQVGNSAKAMNAAFSVASGNLGKLASIGSLGPLAGLAIAAAAAGKLAFSMASVSDALEVAAGGNKLDTWAGQFDRVQEAATSIAQTLGRPISEVLTRETRQLADIMSFIAEKIMPDQIRQEREKVALLEQQKKLEAAKAAQAEQARKAEEAWQKAADDFTHRKGMQLQARGEAIRDSLRTPMEKFKRDLEELDILFSGGHISLQTLQRASDKAAADIIGANKAVQDFKSQMGGPVGAAERFTTAGQSAVAAAQRAAQQAELTKLQLAEEKAQTKHQEELVRLVRNQKGVTLATSSLQ